MKISEIIIKPRFRKDLGDLSELKKSIKEIGLLHPIVVNEYQELVAGRRRLQAYRELGRKDIPTTVIDMEELSRGEYDENVIRKDFTPSEKVAIYEAMESFEHKGKMVSDSDTKGLKKQQRASKVVGLSTDTLSKAKQVVDSGDKGLIKEMDETENVDKAYRRLKNKQKAEKAVGDISKEKVLSKPTGTSEITDNYMLFNKDAREMKDDLKNGSVHLVVTSPPYNVGKDYKASRDDVSVSEYKQLLTDVFSICYSKLVKGGRIAVNIPSTFRTKDDLINYPLIVSEILRGAGFQYRDMIVWDKGKSAKFGTAWGSWMSPSDPWLRSRSEWILIYEKETRTLEGGASDLTEEEFRSWTFNLWKIEPKHHKLHPAVFPEELPKRLIKLYSYVGQAVLDPFMGVGTTGIVALKLKRQFVGYDVSPEYFEEMKNEASRLT